MPLTIDILYVNQESLTVKGEEVPHFVDATRRVTEAASQTFAVEPPTYRDFLIKGEAYLVVVRRLSRSPKNGEYSTQPTDVLVSIPQRSLRESQGIEDSRRFPNAVSSGYLTFSYYCDKLILVRYRRLNLS